MRTFLFLISFSIFSTLSAGVYTWTDSNGNTVFGDSPPESAGVREVELPMLTVADSYFSDKNKDKKSKGQQDQNKNAAIKANDATVVSDTIPYESFTVKSPTKGEALRSNNGNILVQFALKPALQEGHGLVVYLDGKQVANGAATVFSLKAVDRGAHSLFAVVHNENNDVLKNTEAVKFNVLRSSKR